MILNSDRPTVESNFEVTSKTFEIEANDVAFRVLTNKLYSNGIRAVVRELSCNAHDIHVMTGQTKPFIVTCPSMLNKEFSVRDFGTGLTENEIYNVYTTLFKSTKRTTNSAIGCLGLGSKSPFAYENTDSFSIESFVDGVVTNYLCFIDESGKPKVSKLFENPTTEENGLKVSVGVRDDDVHKFANEIRYVFHTFEQKPIIKGTDSTVIDNIFDNKTVIDQDLTILKAVASEYRSYIIMGNIKYNVNHSEYQLPSHIAVIPNGSVTFAPSREELVYDEKTLAYLKSVKTKVVNYLIEDFKKATDELIEAKNYKDLFTYMQANRSEFTRVYVAQIIEPKIKPQVNLTTDGFLVQGPATDSANVTRYKFTNDRLTFNQEWYSEVNLMRTVFINDCADNKTRVTKKIKFARENDSSITQAGRVVSPGETLNKLLTLQEYGFEYIKLSTIVVPKATRTPNSTPTGGTTYPAYRVELNVQTQHVNIATPKRGDVYYVPAGTGQFIEHVDYFKSYTTMTAPFYVYRFEHRSLSTKKFSKFNLINIVELNREHRKTQLQNDPEYLQYVEYYKLHNFVESEVFSGLKDISHRPMLNHLEGHFQILKSLMATYNNFRRLAQTVQSWPHSPHSKQSQFREIAERANLAPMVLSLTEEEKVELAFVQIMAHQDLTEVTKDIIIRFVNGTKKGELV